MCLLFIEDDLDGGLLHAHNFSAQRYSTGLLLMALFSSPKRMLALKKNRKLIAVKLSMGDKNSFICLLAPLEYLNKYCKICEHFAAGGAIGMSDSFDVILKY